MNEAYKLKGCCQFTLSSSSVVWSVGPGNVSGVSWVITGWVGELTIMVLLGQFSRDGLADSDEVVDVLHVGDVGVEVILEMLDEVHVLLDIIISSDSWEGERFIKELPGVDSWWLDLELTGDLHGVEVVLDVKLSGELVHLPVHLISTLPESLSALTLWCSESIDDTGITLIKAHKFFIFAITIRLALNRSGHTVGLDDLDEVSRLGLSVRDSSDEEHNNSRVFHFYKFII